MNQPILIGSEPRRNLLRKPLLLNKNRRSVREHERLVPEKWKRRKAAEAVQVSVQLKPRAH
jgi:hypothetical protein